MSADVRPPGVPDGARLVTLAQLRDDIAKEDGSLRIGPRASVLRARIAPWPFVLRGRVSDVLGGGVSKEHGGRVFSLGWQDGLRGSRRRTRMIFTQPDAADFPVWIWTIDDGRAKDGAR
jgi:hypothetical protein